ncbi:MAG TPA: hypothetical protein VED01_21460 [Burkholderiales bacterium]|nr:hypothetical protein [Burkholderiales bacterium]
MTFKLPLQIADIPWLRLAARTAGAPDVPQGIATKLLAGGFVEQDVKRRCLVITARGKLALSRLT